GSSGRRRWFWRLTRGGTRAEAGTCLRGAGATTKVRMRWPGRRAASGWGGAGKPEHCVRVLTEGCADAALAASIFHYGTYTVNQLKEELDKRAIAVRVAA